MDVNEIINAMEDAPKSKPQFLQFIKLCGYSERHKEYKRLEFLMSSTNEIADWFDSFDGDIDSIVVTTDSYKDKRKSKINLDLTSFLERCRINLKQGLERLFLEECLPHVILELNKKLYQQEISLKNIYNISRMNPWYNNASKFANARWTEMEREKLEA
jgi:hypothetical protein